MKTYAAYYDNIVRGTSSSGAIFSSLAEYVIANNGSVYGVALSEDCMTARYMRVSEIKELNAVRGSKYFQAEVGDTYKQVKQDLKSGILVLFTGVACQINGLRSFLKDEYNNLICVDVICHGVPSPFFWKKYVDGKQVNQVNFRNKRDGWEKYGLQLNNDYIPYHKNRYLHLYLQNHCIRPSCFECVAKKNKKSDITLGDFWGFNNVAPELNDNKGLSVIICRTDKGNELFKSIKNKLIYKEVDYEKAVAGNPCEYASTSKPARRDEFWKDFDVMNFEQLYKKYIPQQPFVSRVKNKVKRVLGR